MYAVLGGNKDAKFAVSGMGLKRVTSGALNGLAFISRMVFPQLIG
jgi:hypothetical protein